MNFKDYLREKILDLEEQKGIMEETIDLNPELLYDNEDIKSFDELIEIFETILEDCSEWEEQQSSVE